MRSGTLRGHHEPVTFKGMNALSSRTVHLVVESGPERGREIEIPVVGARLGRASGNDITLNDPSISRFQCRFYFKNDRELFVADLASTNETLVNGRAIQDLQLFVGDRVTVGESTFKVVCDTLVPDQAPVPAPPPAPVAAAAPAAGTPATAPTPATASAVDIDLGLAPKPAAVPASAGGSRATMARKLIFPLTVVLVAVGGWLAVQTLIRGQAAGTRPLPRSPESLTLRYEKVQASPQNIFRYHLELTGGELRVQVDNLANGQHVRKSKTVVKKVLESLLADLEKSGFQDLASEHMGIPREDVWDQWDLEIGIASRIHRVRVRNRLEPQEFEKARIIIEEFARAELGLGALALQPEELQRQAQEAFLVGQKLYNEKEIRYENLALAIRAFTDVESLLETIEPKPEYYAQAIAIRGECRQLLQKQYDNFMFNAERAMKLRDWRTAADNYQILLQILNDPSDERYEEVDQKLMTAQRYIKR